MKSEPRHDGELLQIDRHRGGSILSSPAGKWGLAMLTHLFQYPPRQSRLLPRAVQLPLGVIHGAVHPDARVDQKKIRISQHFLLRSRRPLLSLSSAMQGWYYLTSLWRFSDEANPNKLAKDNATTAATPNRGSLFPMRVLERRAPQLLTNRESNPIQCPWPHPRRLPASMPVHLYRRA